MAAPDQSIISRKALNALMRRTRSPYLGERAEAERQFRDLGPEGIDALMELLQEKIQRWRKRRRIYFGLVGVFLCVIVAFIIYAVQQVIEYNDLLRAKQLLGIALGGIGGGLGGGILGGFAWLLMPPAELMMAARLLAQVDDLRGIGALARVVEMRTMDYEMRHSAAKALARLLPRIDESTAHLIQGEDRAALTRYLSRCKPELEEELVTAILHALSWTGDADTLRSVRAFGQRVNENPPTEALLDSLRICVERIEERVKISSKSGTLLRPSLTEGTANLLRPAAGAGTEEGAVLLRAGQPGDGSA